MKAGRLAIMPRPRGGDWLEDEIRSLRTMGVDDVVSLLERDEVQELDIEGEKAFCEAVGISFLSFPIADRNIPVSSVDALKFAESIEQLLAVGRHVVIHCRAGIGRSSIIAACVLMKSGLSFEESFQKIEKARGCSVPDTPEQKEWVRRVSMTI